MKRNATLAAAVPILLLAGAAAAYVLDAGVTKSANKWRSDVQKQSNKYTDCVVKALLKCEKKGASELLECDPSCDTSTGTGGSLDFDGVGACVKSTHPDKANAEPAFRAGIDSCGAAFDPGKAAFDYDGDGTANSLGDQPAIGCLGDCSDSDGTQLDAATCGTGDINSNWVAGVTGPSGGVRSTLTLFSLQFALICPGDPVCANEQGKILAKLTSQVNKTIQKCEEDFKDKKGNGGTTDDGSVCHVTSFNPDGSAAAGNPDLVAVVNDLHAQLGAAQALVPTIVGGLQDVADGVYNRQIDFDSGGSPPVVGAAAPSCGTCGDGTIDFGEECDPAAALPPGCGSCPSTLDFLAGQTPCQCQ